MQSCSYLASKNISINFYWVFSYLRIYKNKIVDKLVKKGLSRKKKQSFYIFLVYIGKLVKKKFKNKGKITGDKIKIKENIILESLKETTPFLLKPLKINILKGYN